jgi:SAM-dependent methyltransferase
LLWPDKEYRSDLDVLVAGCGTWQAAKYALCHPDARVVGIDVSPTSLEHTETLKRKYDLTNLVTRHLPIESVAKLDQRFDLIVCTGVLHHLVDPDAGLRALQSVLRSEGAMYLMVYAPYGRTGVYMLQEYCRRLGIGISKEEIHDLNAVLKVLPEHHPLLATLRGSRDSLNAEALVDALLNPRDRTYSVPELFDFIERNELVLGRWYWQAPYLPQCGLIAETPHASRLIALPEREQYMAMELWRGLMNIHSFVVYRSDVNNDGLKVLFDDERYLRYVPIRLPWTICVQEGLPAGVSGILVNKTHVFDDLMLFIDAREKRMFEAIDGNRSISEILDKVKEKRTSPLFFKKLWWYDQVVFDTSITACAKSSV